MIDGDFATGNATGNGLADERTAGGQLFISNTTVRNTGQSGIIISPGGPAGTVVGGRIDAALDNLRLENARVGVLAINNVRVTINRSVLAGNNFAGLFASGTSTEVNASNNVISSNTTGVQNAGGAVTIRLANNDITLNGTAISGAAQSYGNNRLQGNTAAGTAPTPINQQ